MADKKSKSKTTKKKSNKNVPLNGIVYVQATFNNTLINITDTSGNALFWSSAGLKQFKGARKGTPFAAQICATEAAQNAFDSGMRNVKVLINGPGAGRESVVRAVASVGMKVTEIKDITPVPHNGCRPPKRRRV